MPNVLMPDGALVAMPDTPDPELDARLHNAYVTQTNAKASGLTPGTPQWDKMTRGRVDMGPQMPSPTAPSAIDSLLGAPTGTGEAIRTMGQNLIAGGAHGVGDLVSRIFGRGPAPNAGSSLVHQPSSPEAADLLHTLPQLDPHHLVAKGGDALVRGVGHVAGDTAADLVRQTGQVGTDAMQIANVAAPLISGARGLVGDTADATAITRSPEDVRTAAGYTNLGTKADMHAPGSLATTDPLAADDLHIPKGTVPSQQAI